MISSAPPFFYNIETCHLPFAGLERYNDILVKQHRARGLLETPRRGILAVLDDDGRKRTIGYCFLGSMG